MDYVTEIIELIRKNRISTTEVADALGKFGSVQGLIPLSPLKFAVGKIKCVVPINNSNYMVHREIETLEPGDILFIRPKGFTDVAVFGDLVAKYAILYRQAAAIVVEGNVRDTARLVREQYPIWCFGSNPVGAVNVIAHTKTEELDSEGMSISNGIAVCDEGGVVIIEKERLNEELLGKLHHIEALEDLWHYCMNTLKWSTYDIVVKKRYLEDRDLIPKDLLQVVLQLEGKEL